MFFWVFGNKKAVQGMEKLVFCKKTSEKTLFNNRKNDHRAMKKGWKNAKIMENKFFARCGASGLPPNSV